MSGDDQRAPAQDSPWEELGCRRVASTNLIALGFGAFALGVFQMVVGRYGTAYMLLGVFVPLTFCVLWLVKSTGGKRNVPQGSRRVGYGLLALVSLAAAPFGLLVAASTVGSLTLLGLGFLIIGWRTRSSRVWMIAGFGALLGVLTDSTRGRVALTDLGTSDAMPGMLTAAYGAAVIAVAVLSLFSEAKRTKTTGE
ncbi:hypothetical protein [Prescottella agglutinans]|uniref:Uncharacterized protein n=1 Tax=Prescottella agglutinans TaxID=1644129 RepID=A0ABT6MJL3_9NOCA|nr:hypothetical protein [Prescottella agglutinans]MDH6284084.1 hypothetical protein [Prescottella agglutinans]